MKNAMGVNIFARHSKYQIYTYIHCADTNHLESVDQPGSDFLVTVQLPGNNLSTVMTAQEPPSMNFSPGEEQDLASL